MVGIMIVIAGGSACLIGHMVDCHEGSELKKKLEGIEKKEVKWENGDRDERRY